MATPLILSGSVILGALSPEALVIDVVPSDRIPDLSVVSAVDLEVHGSGGVVETWTCTISNRSALGFTLTHPYVAANTATVVSYHIIPRFTIPAGVIRGRVCILAVVKP
jgi:hypothetical protein